MRALDALTAISGNLFVPDGGCSFYFRRRKAFSAFEFRTNPPRTVREPLLGADMLAATAPKIRLCWITAGNPVAMLPDSAAVAAALDATEFVVVADCLLTKTTKQTNLMLPIPSLLKNNNLLKSYKHH